MKKSKQRKRTPKDIRVSNLHRAAARFERALVSSLQDFNPYRLMGFLEEVFCQRAKERIKAGYEKKMRKEGKKIEWEED